MSSSSWVQQMRMMLLWFAVVAMVIPTIRAGHDVSYNANSTALSYKPSGNWRVESGAGCGWPSGRWAAAAPSTITLYFEGVDLYTFVVFDGPTNPIYTIQIDEEPPVRLGDDPIPSSKKCDPVFSKMGMTYSKHRAILTLTKERPYDVTDLRFQGFVAKVPDPWENVAFNSTAPYSNSTSPGDSSSSVTLSSKLIQIIVWSSIGVVALLLVTCCCLCGSLRGGNNNRPNHPGVIAGSSSIHVSRITLLAFNGRANNANIQPEVEAPPPPPYQRNGNNGSVTTITTNANAKNNDPSAALELSNVKAVGAYDPSPASTHTRFPTTADDSHQTWANNNSNNNNGNNNNQLRFAETINELRRQYQASINDTGTAPGGQTPNAPSVHNPSYQPPVVSDSSRGGNNTASGNQRTNAHMQSHWHDSEVLD
ncbi:hypothetical protein FRC19_007489 [Serendipita sp. 401]|nr:hypothetical protein FRC16_009590 [Serendipita sp. 398]KAG8821653.1 hypothetical protein FRC19_007489 [Serendipita sp. 401]